MELDELKQKWQQSRESKRDRKELAMMTQVQQHPKLKRIRFKLIFEAVILLVFVFTYNDILDGSTKPLWANITLIAGVSLFVISDIISYLMIYNPIKADNLKLSIESFGKNLKRLSIFSVSSTLLFGSSVILFMISTIDLTQIKQLMILGMIVTLIVLAYLSYKNWSLRIKSIQTTLEGFNS